MADDLHKTGVDVAVPDLSANDPLRVVGVAWLSETIVFRFDLSAVGAKNYSHSTDPKSVRF